ncbi:hypothetical protein [Pelagibius marinus]|uniref:hypothetical protein n=1 Tax=Pelagibius marinus TaxID=2762760 RepID=UPI0018723814|nr:hypothetical protein [Pelagibius marinus]
MIRHLVFVLGLLATLLPGTAAARDVTWQDVAQSFLIVAGTPEPYESKLLSQDDLQNRRLLQVKNPVFLKGDQSDIPVLLQVLPYDLVLWNQPTVFFLRKFSLEEGAEGRELYGLTSWYDSEGMFRLDYGPRPRPYTDGLAAQIRKLIAQNDHYREIGAAYKPDPDDPLLAEVQRDLHEIANSLDLQGGTEPAEIAPHSLAIRRLLYRGEDIVPRLVSLLDTAAPFPAGYIIEDPTHFQWMDAKPPPSAGNKAEAIDILLRSWSGFIFGYRNSFPTHRSVVELWQTYLGYQLSGIDPLQVGPVDWKLIAQSQLIAEGTLTIAEDRYERDIYKPYSSIWATLSDPRFLKGEDQGAPYRIPLNKHWIRRAKKIEGKVVVFSRGRQISTADQQPFYGLVLVEDHKELHRSEGFDFNQLDTVLAISRSYRESGGSFQIDANDPYWSELRRSLESIATASGKDEFSSAVQRVIEYGEPAVPYLIALLTAQEPWPYGKIFSFLERPWLGTPSTVYAKNWGHIAMQSLNWITELPLSEWPIGPSLVEEPGRSAYWSAYLGQRLSTPEGRLSLSHDPAVSKAEALRRAISAELPPGVGRPEIDAFFDRRELSPFYDEFSYYGAISPRYQAVVPDANPDDDLDETVVVHIFLDNDARLIGSDVRYLFDLYR